MTTVYAPFVEMSAAEFERVTRVVYLGVVNGTRAALQRMRPRRRGAIVNVGSGLAYHAIPLQSAYCGAKFAIRGFTEAIRAELIHDELPISLSMVHLPGVNTPQFDWARNRLARKPQPAPPVYEPEVAARAIVKAADEGVRELFVGTSTLQLFLGSVVAPGFLERMMAASAYDAQQSAEAGARPSAGQPVRAGAGPPLGARPLRRPGARARPRRQLDHAAPRHGRGRRAPDAADRRRPRRRCCAVGGSDARADPGHDAVDRAPPKHAPRLLDRAASRQRPLRNDEAAVAPSACITEAMRCGSPGSSQNGWARSAGIGGSRRSARS